MDEVKFERGQVYYVRYDDSVGGEMAIGRPVLIVSSQEDMDDLDTVVVVFLTTGLRKSKNVVEVRVNGKKQYVHCSQVHTMSKTRMRDYQGKLRSADMLKIDENLSNALGLSHYICDNNETEVTETLVPVAEPVDIRVAESKEDEVISLKAELEIQKKLYAKAVERIIELQLAKDTRVVVEEKIVEVEKPREMTEEEILEWIDKLGEKSSEKVVKKGRPVGSGKPKSCEIPMKIRKPDGKYRVPTTEELAPYKKKGKVNINTDTWATIAATLGIGVGAAQSLEAYRNKHGKFEVLEDLVNVKGFSLATIEKHRSKMEV